MNRRTFLSGALLLATGCVGHHRGITIGSKNFTEQLILGEMLAQYLEHANAGPIERRFYLAGTYICHQALLSGRIDMYVEYTGTALAAVLKEQPLSGHKEVFDEVRDGYQRRFGLVVMPSLGFNNSFAIIMRGPEARRLGVRALSGLAPHAPQLRMGVGYEFLERSDGYKGLVGTYGLNFAEAPRVMDLGLMYRALENKQVDLIAGANTDGLIAALDVVVLDDDRHYFPPYDAVPIIRRDTLTKIPTVKSAMERLAGKITADEMRKLNYAVDGQKQDASRVVSEFLVQKKFFSAGVV